MINDLSNADAIPMLERLVQFAGQRHRLITNNIANLSTPGFRPADVSVADFQAQLREAIDARRSKPEAAQGQFVLRSSRQVDVAPDGLTLHPEPVGENLMFHDGNDRDVDRTMQSLVENFMTFRAAAQLLKSRFDLLGAVIRERA